MIEIERKFLLRDGDQSWRGQAVRSCRIVQGYFESAGRASVRVRVTAEKAVLTIKGPANGCARSEFEYVIPPGDANMMLMQFCGPRTISKTRYFVPAAEAGLTWEIDEYHGALEGGLNAELEIPSADFEFQRPQWLGREVTDDWRYANAALALAQRWPELHGKTENPC